MAVDKHPSRAPAKPYKPPATSTTSGTKNKIEHGSGQCDVEYGFRHELQVKNPNRSEMSSHFTSKSESPNEGSVSKAGHVGDTKKSGEPG